MSDRETQSFSTGAAHAKAVELAKHVLTMTTASGTGHPSTGVALSHIVVELMYRQMRYDPADPWNPNSDRLVLSIGHGVPIVYAAYADLGGAVGDDKNNARKLTIDDLATLREQDSVLDGHPNPAEGFPFFDAATGSLGQGLSVGAGFALAAVADGSDKRIYVIVGDGEAREGQVWEAADFIVDHKLTNLCAIFSCNGHGQAGPVSPQQSAEAIGAKMAAFGWHVVEIDGHNPEELAKAFSQVGTLGKPTAIVARTVKGWGIDLMLGRNFHGKPLSQGDLKTAMAQLDATGDKLGAAPGEAFRPPKPSVGARGTKKAVIELPSLEVALKRVGLDSAWDKKELATRNAYGAALVALGDADGRVVAIDGDVSNSTFSIYFAEHHADRFFECKIAEQNMVSVAAGMSAAGKIPFASTFAKFLARAVDQIDMAAISRANVKLVGSHAGVSLAADGPSQMAISDMAYFRSMTKADCGHGPIFRVFHPSDAVSAYRCTELMANVDGMCYLRTHRPNAPFLYDVDERFELDRCKQLRTGDRLTLVSSGFMVHQTLVVADRLSEAGVACNVFDAYTFPFDALPILKAARKSGGAILTIEDNLIGGLHAELAEQAAVVGDVRVVGMTVNRLPKSARSPKSVFDYVGVGVDQIVATAKKLVGG